MKRRAELLARLERTGPVLRRRIAGDSRAALLARYGGITLHQLGALRLLSHAGPLSMNELAARLEISPSSATQLVDRLVHHGLAERMPHPDDRRALRVIISGSAAPAVKEFEADTKRRIADLLAPLSDKELQQLADIAERLVGAETPGAEQAGAA